MSHADLHPYETKQYECSRTGKMFHCAYCHRIECDVCRGKEEAS